MSIVAGRVFLIVTALVTIVCAVLGFCGFGAGWDGSATILAIGVVGALFLGSALVVLPIFAESHVDCDRVVLRYVLRPRRVVRRADIDEILVLTGVRIPGGAGTRVLLRAGGNPVAVFTPLRERFAVEELRVSGIEPRVDPDPLTPGRARRGDGNGFAEGDRKNCRFAKRQSNRSFWSKPLARPATACHCPPAAARRPLPCDPHPMSEISEG